MTENGVPGTTAPAATTASTPATTPTTTTAPLGGVLTSTQGGSVTQTSLTKSLGGSVVSTLPSQLQLETLQSALQAVQPGSLLSAPSFEVPQVPVFVPGMAMSSPFNMHTLAGALPGVTIPPGLDVDALASIVGKMAIEHATLLKSKRERDIDVEVGLYSNPMSKRSVEHDMRLSDSVESIVSAMVHGNTVVQATPHNYAEINQIFDLILSSVQELRDRIASDRSKHLIAKTSSLGWKFVSSLELLEGKVGHLSMVQLRNQEKAYLAQELAVSSMGKSGSGAAADGGGGGGGGGTTRGRRA
jgi:hypothetical protein